MKDDKPTSKFYKMYFFARTDLGMRKGKTAGQVGHAAARLGRMIPDEIWEQYLEYEVKYVYAVFRKSELPTDDFLASLEKDDPESLYTKVIDAGKTQIPPDTLTVVGIFTNLDLNPDRKWKLMS